MDQNFSSKDLKRVIRERSTLDKLLRIPPDMKVRTRLHPPPVWSLGG